MRLIYAPIQRECGTYALNGLLLEGFMGLEVDLESKGIVITGGLGDLGSAMTKQFLQCGASVTLIDLKDADDTRPLLEELGKYGNVCYVRADVTNRRSVGESLARVDSLDVGVGNAGIARGCYEL